MCQTAGLAAPTIGERSYIETLARLAELTRSNLHGEREWSNF